MIPWLLIPLGIAIIVYSNKIGSWTGEINVAERIFGTNGTYLFIKLLGLAITILSFMWITGGLQEVLESLFKKFFGIK